MQARGNVASWIARITILTGTPLLSALLITPDDLRAKENETQVVTHSFSIELKEEHSKSTYQKIIDLFRGERNDSVPRGDKVCLLYPGFGYTNIASSYPVFIWRNDGIRSIRIEPRISTPDFPAFAIDDPDVLNRGYWISNRAFPKSQRGYRLIIDFWDENEESKTSLFTVKNNVEIDPRLNDLEAKLSWDDIDELATQIATNNLYQWDIVSLIVRKFSHFPTESNMLAPSLQELISGEIVRLCESELDQP